MSMKCPYCDGPTMVKATGGRPKIGRRFLAALAFSWPHAVSRRRYCLSDDCRRRYNTIEISIDDLQVMLVDVIKQTHQAQGAK